MSARSDARPIKGSGVTLDDYTDYTDSVETEEFEASCVEGVSSLTLTLDGIVAPETTLHPFRAGAVSWWQAAALAESGYSVVAVVAQKQGVWDLVVVGAKGACILASGVGSALYAANWAGTRIPMCR